MKPRISFGQRLVALAIGLPIVFITIAAQSQNILWPIVFFLLVAIVLVFIVMQMLRRR